MVKLMRKPSLDIDKFDGDALLYRRFVRQFDNYVSAFCDNDHERLTYLEKFTTGEAHRVVMGYSNLGSHAGYVAAMRALEERYGNEENIASAYVQKALNWPVIKISDVKALDSIFLRECLHAIEEVGALGVLEYQGNLKAMVERLPYKLHDRLRGVVESKLSSGRRVRFSDLVDFASLEARKARNPIYGRDVLKCPPEANSAAKAKKQKTQPTKSRCLASKVANEIKKESKEETKEETKELTTPCLMCGCKHDMDECDEFLKATLESKQTFAKSNGICFGCLERGHLNKTCKNRKQCRSCNKRHPTAFHEFYAMRRTQQTDKNTATEGNKDHNETQLKELDTTVSFCVNGSQKTVTSMTVPVYVSHVNNPQKEELVYALLDTQSEISYITSKVCDRLGIKGAETHLNLSTLALDNEIIPCRRITGLQVRGHDSTKKLTIPKAFTQDKIPANLENVPSREIALEWKHLQPIANEMLPKGSCEIAMLIGYKCHLAFKPRKLVYAPDDEGLFAVKADLGWSIFGATCAAEEEDDAEVHTSHRIISKETVGLMEEKKSVAFAVTTSKVREVINPNDILKALETDFVERKTRRNQCL